MYRVQTSAADRGNTLATHWGNVAAADVMLPFQGGPELQLQLLLVLAGVHQLLVAARQLGLQVFYLRAAGAAQGAEMGQHC